MKQNKHLLAIGVASLLLNASCKQQFTSSSESNLAHKGAISATPTSAKPNATSSDASLTAKSPHSTTKATDSDEIRTSTNYKISFKNLNELMKIAQLKDRVVFKQKVESATELEEKIKSMNEETFCQIKVQGSFHSEDYLKLASTDLQQVDKKNDIFQSRLIFNNANGEVQFLCTHTTFNFYVEEFAMNMNNLLHIFDLDSKEVSFANYINPRTENRIGNAVKIKSIENFNKVLIKEEASELFGMVDGKIMDLDEASSLVANKKSKMSCAIAQVAGKISTDKVYIRVEKGVIEETPAGVPTASLFATYRADEENAFVVTCFALKTASWFELTRTANSVLQFGVLERPEYNIKYDEVMALHKKLMEKN